jgi:hypothetical protein
MIVRKLLGLVVMVLMAGYGQMAEAVPITYLGTLQSGVPVTDTVPDGGPDNPLLADYWQFTLAQDAQVTITGHRLEADLDPAFHVFRGTFADTDEFGGSLGSGNIAELDFGDDELPAAIPGPFGDPQSILQLPAGTYTVAFVSFDNGSNSGPWAYCLELNGPATCNGTSVPAPASLLLLGLGAGLAGFAGRGRLARLIR